ncbi:putative F-box protein [Drosera capensis]
MPQATKKKSKPTQSIREIHDDVVLQILLRLPLKPLLRFRSVSKSWNQMIMHEDSIDLYHTRCKEAKHSSDSESLFIIKKYDQCYVSKMPELNEAVEAFSLRRVMEGHDCDVCEKLHDWVRDWSDRMIYPIVGSSNGVVCIFKNGKLVLSNVVTSTHRFVKCLVIEESKRSAKVTFGFGYDRRSYDYKIVRIVFERVTDNYKAEHTVAYSLNSDSWKIVGACTMSNLLTSPQPELVFVNGVDSSLRSSEVMELGQEVENPKKALMNRDVMNLPVNGILHLHVENVKVVSKNKDAMNLPVNRHPTSPCENPKIGSDGSPPCFWRLSIEYKEPVEAMINIAPLRSRRMSLKHPSSVKSETS